MQFLEWQCKSHKACWSFRCKFGSSRGHVEGTTEHVGNIELEVRQALLHLSAVVMDYMLWFDLQRDHGSVMGTQTVSTGIKDTCFVSG